MHAGKCTLWRELHTKWPPGSGTFWTELLNIRNPPNIYASRYGNPEIKLKKVLFNKPPYFCPKHLNRERKAGSAFRFVATGSEGKSAIAVEARLRGK